MPYILYAYYLCLKCTFFFFYLQNNIYYHLYHCHLDVRWFQLTLLSELPKSKDTFKHSLHNALNDLVQLARNRFKKVNWFGFIYFY